MNMAVRALKGATALLFLKRVAVSTGFVISAHQGHSKKQVTHFEVAPFNVDQGGSCRGPSDVCVQRGLFVAEVNR